MSNLLDNWMTVDVDQLVPADWNYKEDDEFMDGQLRNGIKKNGMVQNLIIRRLDGERFEVVNGNHRLTILRQLGRKKVVVYNLGDVSIAEAKRIAVETNELHYESNQLKLAATLRSIAEETPAEELLKTMPYDSDHLESLLKAPVFDMSEYSKEPQPDPTDDTPPLEQEQGVEDDIDPVVVGEGAGSISMVPMKKDIYKGFMEQVERINAMAAHDGRWGTKQELKDEGNIIAIDILTRVVKEVSDGTIRRVLKNYASETPLETPPQ